MIKTFTTLIFSLLFSSCFAFAATSGPNYYSKPDFKEAGFVKFLTFQRDGQSNGIIAASFEPQSETDKNRGVKRLERLSVFYFSHDGGYELVNSISLQNMRAKKGALVYHDQVDIVRLKSTDISDQGGTAQLLLLRDITSIISKIDDSVIFNLMMRGETPVLVKNSSDFNVLNFKTRTLFGKAVGIEKVSFCQDDCDSKEILSVEI